MKWLRFVLLLVVLMLNQIYLIRILHKPICIRASFTEAEFKAQVSLKPLLRTINGWSRSCIDSAWIPLSTEQELSEK